MEIKLSPEERAAITPLVEACLLRAHAMKRRVLQARHRAWCLGKVVDRTKAVIEAEALFQGGLDMLAVVLDQSGISTAGYGDLPSADSARLFLERWEHETGKVATL